MSYGPPPARTPYGDQDFIKEDWPQQQTVSEHNQGIPFNASTKSVYPMPPSHQAPVYGQPSPDNSLVQNLNQPSVIPLAEATKSLTHDDILFLRSWRQDSFYYRGKFLTRLIYSCSYTPVTNFLNFIPPSFAALCSWGRYPILL